uniref:Uncharacterized protein n=1 Tax=Knipowitschia caucasica TaxID=637954 RepID=A0AAV2KW09_KNICA
MPSYRMYWQTATRYDPIATVMGPGIACGAVYSGPVYNSTAGQSTAGQSTAMQRETGKRAKYNAATPTTRSVCLQLQSVVWQRWSEVVRVQLGTRPGQWAVATWGAALRRSALRGRKGAALDK